MKKVESNNPEVKAIKVKYKNLRKNILLILLVILVIFIVSLSVKTLKIQSLFRANLSETLGDNYKITRTGYTNGTKYIKDDIVLQNNKGISGVLSYKGKGYTIMYETKEYVELEFHIPSFTRENLMVSDFLSLSGDNVNSFFKMVYLVLLENVKLSEDVIDSKECYTVSGNNSETKLWFDKETDLLIKEEHSGTISNVKIEIGTVTDEDVKLPWDLGFTKTEYGNKQSN